MRCVRDVRNALLSVSHTHTRALSLIRVRVTCACDGVWWSLRSKENKQANEQQGPQRINVTATVKEQRLCCLGVRESQHSVHAQETPKHTQHTHVLPCSTACPFFAKRSMLAHSTEIYWMLFVNYLRSHLLQSRLFQQCRNRTQKKVESEGG